MREIKFRGMSVHELASGNRWLYGNVCIGEYSYIEDMPVDEKTVGQYTGLKDSEGTEIYEGDILEDFINEKRYQVFWDDYGMFIFTELSSTTGGLDYYELEEEAAMDCLMVIGNIHENPELLEVSV